MFSKSNKSFVSEADKCLEQLRKDVPESEEQCKERKKYERINRLRDKASPAAKEGEIWQDF